MSSYYKVYDSINKTLIVVINTIYVYEMSIDCNTPKGICYFLGIKSEVTNESLFKNELKEIPEQIMEKIKTLQWFDKNGWWTASIDDDTIEQCTIGGRDAEPYIKQAIEVLDFSIPKDLIELAIAYLLEYGSWERKELENIDTLTVNLFWVICCDLSDKEKGFIGLHY